MERKGKERSDVDLASDQMISHHSRRDIKPGDAPFLINLTLPANQHD
jgi:hypothetical protein